MSLFRDPAVSSRNRFTFISCPPIRISITLAVLGLLLGVTGCWSSPPSPLVAEGRTLLQTNHTQEAIDLLTRDDSAESHYLMAVGLYRMKIRETAKQHVRTALDKDPENPKYRALELLIDMAERNTLAADKIIDIYDLNRSSGAIAFFATWAYLSKQDVTGSVRAFETALALTADAPEFMLEMLHHTVAIGHKDAASSLIERLSAAGPDDADLTRTLLEFAVKGGLVEPTRELLSRLESLSPNDPELPKLRVHALLVINRKAEAIKAAEDNYARRKQDEEAAMMLAHSLASAPANASRDAQFEELTKAFPRNMEIVAKYAIYLTRSERLPAAIDLINANLARQTEPIARRHLMDIGIGLPLQIGNIELLETQIERYRKDLEAVYVTYLEGRLFFLQKDFDKAMGRFQDVVNAQKDDVQSNRSLATDSLLHIDRILQERVRAAQIEGALERVEKLTPGSNDEKTPEKEPQPAPADDTKSRPD